MSRDGVYYRGLAGETDARLAALCLEYDPDAIQRALVAPAVISDEGLAVSCFLDCLSLASLISGREDPSSSRQGETIDHQEASSVLRAVRSEHGGGNPEQSDLIGPGGLLGFCLVSQPCFEASTSSSMSVTVWLCMMSSGCSMSLLC